MKALLKFFAIVCLVAFGATSCNEKNELQGPDVEGLGAAVKSVIHLGQNPNPDNNVFSVAITPSYYKQTNNQHNKEATKNYKKALKILLVIFRQGMSYLRYSRDSPAFFFPYGERKGEDEIRDCQLSN